MCCSIIQKHVSQKKWCKYYKYFVCELAQKFSDHMEIKGIKHILINLCCTKYNEISVFHSDIQKPFSYEK